MIINKTELIINDFIKYIVVEDIDENYINLYGVDKNSTSVENKMNLLFAYFHQELNQLFDFMNYKIGVNFHYNADKSRKLIEVIKAITFLKQKLVKSKFKFDIDKKYELKMQKCSEFLSEYSGSKIPEDTEIFSIEKYEKIFILSNSI